MGFVRRGWWLPRLQTIRSGLGAWPASGDQRVMGRCQCLCGVAVGQDPQDVPAPERGRARRRDARRDDDAVLVGLFDFAPTGELRRQLHLRERAERRVSATDRAGGFFPAEPMGALPSAWRWVGMDRGLL